MILKAFCVAYKAHKGQVDKAGKAYIFHPLTVASYVKGKQEKTVALLHDVVEDSCITFDDLARKGFSADVIEAVKALTKEKGESYNGYLSRVKANDIAKTVKLADLKHNSNLKRLKQVTDKDKKRVIKYRMAAAFLNS